MNAVKHASWLFALLLSLASSVWWYVARSTPINQLDAQTLLTTTDMFVTQLSVQQYDTKGHLTHSLQSPFVRHIPFNNTHLLQTPHITIKEVNQPAWEINAKEATALHGGKQITFNKNVIIRKKVDAHTQETTLTTEEMTYFTQDKLAIAPRDVTFLQAGNKLQSVGMKAYLAENRMQLLNHARGTYSANHG